MLSRNRCSSNSILNFDNKLMKGTKTFCKFLEDTSKGVWFYRPAALQPIYLLKRALLLKKILMVMVKMLKHIKRNGFHYNEKFRLKIAASTMLPLKRIGFILKDWFQLRAMLSTKNKGFAEKN